MRARSQSGEVAVGGQLTDTAVVGGLVNPVAGATVDFRLYGPDDDSCSRPPVFESLGRPLGPDGSASSEPFTAPRPGVYRWRAFYSGDANNEAVEGPWNAANENVTVTGPPTITVRTSRRSKCIETRFTLRVRVPARGRTRDARRQDDQALHEGQLHGSRAHARAADRAPRAARDRDRRRRAVDALDRIPPLRRAVAATVRGLTRVRG